MRLSAETHMVGVSCVVGTLPHMLFDAYSACALVGGTVDHCKAS